MSAQTKTRDNLEVGDQVVIGHRRGPYTIENVTKVTKTQITTDSGKRFTKRTGDVVDGDTFRVNSYIAQDHRLGHFGLMSVERALEINAENNQAEERRRLVRAIQDAANSSSVISNVSFTDLQTIAKLLGL